MGSWCGLHAFVAACLCLACGCSGTSSNPPATAQSGGGSVRVRFAEGAPELEAIINGVPQSIGQAYLQVNGQTVSSTFNYGSLTTFVPLSPGRLTLQALSVLGYRVGPFKSSHLTAGNDYTLALVGSYPNYRVLTFEEPASSKGSPQLSLYEASPAVPSADFGSFTASSRSNYKRLGSATLGNVATVSLGAHVANFGGYAGNGTKPFMCGSVACGDVTPASVDTFNKHNELPFHNASRLSLFLFDVNSGSAIGPVVGSLDQ